MPSGKTYYCSSPALDWRLSGNNTVEGHLEADPLIYSSKASLERLFQYVDTEKGQGQIPARPDTTFMQGKLDDSAQMTITSTKNAIVNRVAKNATPPDAAPLPTISKVEGASRSETTVKKNEEAVNKTKNPTVAPSSKRKRDSKEEAAPSTRGKFRQKWTDWEDEIMTKAIASAGEKAVDWNAIVSKINEGREAENPRSMMSIKMHYIQVIKAKMVQA